MQLLIITQCCIKNNVAVKVDFGTVLWLKLIHMVALFAIMCSIHSQEIKSPKFGKGIFNIVGQDSSWTIKVELRFQLLGTSTRKMEKPPKPIFSDEVMSKI